MPESIPKPRCGLCGHYRSKRDDGAPKMIKGYGWCRKKKQEASANQTMPITDCFESITDCLELPKSHGWKRPSIAADDFRSWVKVVTCDDCPCLYQREPYSRCQLGERDWGVGHYYKGGPAPYWCPLRTGPAAIVLKDGVD